MRGLLYCVFLISCMLASCVCECLEVEGESSGVYAVRFDLRQQGLSRGSISPDESVIDNFNIYVYSRGLLMACQYMEQSEDASMELNVGALYNIYVIANVGRVDPPVDEDELLEDYTYEIFSMEDIKDYLPLAGSLKNVSVTGSGQRFSVLLDRLVSKIVFSLDKSALAGMEVTSVRLRQAALSVRPFCQEKSAAMSSSDVADGDYCTEEDLWALNNAGGAVSFYALENRQGVLLPDNDDPWNKTPLLLDEKADLCTYLEVNCRLDGSGLCAGDVVYRLYLGQDNCTDFNIYRNSILEVSLYLTVDGMKEAISWRVTSDYSLNDGYAYGWISRGNHSEHELYVGEKFEYSLSLSDQMVDYIGSELSDCEVYFRSSSMEEGHVRFSELKTYDEGGYYVEATCLKPSEGEICLREKDGRVLAVLSDYVCINAPLMVLSDKPDDSGDSRLVSNVESLDCYINGSEAVAYLYFVDKQMFNLNVSNGCGYDLSVFDLDAQVVDDSDDVLVSKFAPNLISGTSSDGGPAMTLSAGFLNDGRHHGNNMRLLEACRDGVDLLWVISESVCALNEEIKLYLGSLPVELSLMDNGWAGYGDCQLSLAVDNPSCLPVEVDCWQFVTVDLDYDASLKDVSADKVENSLIINNMEYVVKQFPDSVRPVYGSSFSFVSERNDCGSKSIEDGDLLVYNLYGIDTDDIIAALNFDGWGYDTMSHHFQVTHSDGYPVSELIVNDRLSDGSPEYEKKYGIDNLNDRGVWLYEGDSLILAPDQMFKPYCGLTPDNINTMLNQTPVIAEMSYDKEVAALYVKAFSLGSEGLVLDSKTVAEAEGYVRTYPDGTWRKEVDNYCHEEITTECTAFPVRYSNSSVIADGNAVTDLFNQIYSNTYYDSWNKLGSANNYMHSAHPTSLSLDMSFRISDQNDRDAYLFKPIFPSIVTFRHAQEGVEYNVPVKFSYATFKFVEVTKK